MNKLSCLPYFSRTGGAGESDRAVVSSQWHSPGTSSTPLKKGKMFVMEDPVLRAWICLPVFTRCPPPPRFASSALFSRRVAGYVEQQDMHSAVVTVKEVSAQKRRKSTLRMQPHIKEGKHLTSSGRRYAVSDKGWAPSAGILVGAGSDCFSSAVAFYVQVGMVSTSYQFVFRRCSVLRKKQAFYVHSRRKERHALSWNTG